MLTILHVAKINDSGYTGVNVVVPQHVNAQGKFANTAFINISEKKISSIKTQLHISLPVTLSQLPSPYNHPDLVVFHEPYYLPYLSFAHQLQKSKIPYIIVPHGELRVEAQKIKRLKKIVANFLLFNRFINGSAGLQCLSDEEKDNTHFKPLKFIGTNGIYISREEKSSFHAETTNFIYIGRYQWAVKGLDILLDAIKIKENFLRENNCHLDMYGPDYNGRYAALEKMIEERTIGDIVTLHHEIGGEEKKNALLNADIFIQTSRHEGMPVGILEAMSYGLPCLLTEGTTLSGVVKQHDLGWGTLTDSEDVAEKIERSVIERNLWNSKGANARKFVKENFEWDRVAQETVSMYEKLISKKAK